jgi:hypothetical protein
LLINQQETDLFFSSRTADIKSAEHAKRCGGAGCAEEDGNWDPAKDLVGSDLVLN